MNFTLQRSTRTAGCVALIVGLFMKNWSVMIFSDVVILVGYLWSANKIERYIEAQEGTKVE